MKNKIIISFLVFAFIFVAMPLKNAFAYGTVEDCEVILAYGCDDVYYQLVGFTTNNVYFEYSSMYAQWILTGQGFAGYSQPTSSFSTIDDAISYYTDSVYFNYSGTFTGLPVRKNTINRLCVLKGTVNNIPDLSNLVVIDPPAPPPEPEPTWWEYIWSHFLIGDNSIFVDLWDWLWPPEEITGGDRMPETEVASPTPSPSPIPYRTEIIDGVITYVWPDPSGGPDITSYQPPTEPPSSGGGDPPPATATPRPIQYYPSATPYGVDIGLGQILEDEKNFVDEQSENVKAAGDSFSTLPADLFLLVGFLAVIPFLGGFIRQLLRGG